MKNAWATLAMVMMFSSIAANADYDREVLYRRNGSEYWENENKTAVPGTFNPESMEVTCSQQNGKELCLFSGVTESGVRSPEIELQSKTQALALAKMARDLSKSGNAIAFAAGEFSDTKKPFRYLSDRIRDLEQRLSTMGTRVSENDATRSTATHKDKTL